MIFATCGTSAAQFRRMMAALEALPADQLHVQHGPEAPPTCARAYDYLPFNRMVELIEQADVVVSHAGVGSIMCALRAGHVPIVFPRLKRYNETVDDHQAELAQALAERGNVIVAWTPEELVAAVGSCPPRGIGEVVLSDQLREAVHAAIHGEPHPVFVPRRREARGALRLGFGRRATTYRAVERSATITQSRDPQIPIATSVERDAPKSALAEQR